MDLVDGRRIATSWWNRSNVRVVVDPKSALFVSGSLSDYSDGSAEGRVQGHKPERGRALFPAAKAFAAMTDYFACSSNRECRGSIQLGFKEVFQPENARTASRCDSGRSEDDLRN